MLNLNRNIPSDQNYKWKQTDFFDTVFKTYICMYIYITGLNKIK